MVDVVTEIEEMLVNSTKASLVSYIDRNPGRLLQVIDLAVADHQPY